MSSKDGLQFKKKLILDEGEKCSEFLFGHANSNGRTAHVSGQEGPPMKQEFASHMRCMSLTNGC
jgi:hypothetical protein